MIFKRKIYDKMLQWKAAEKGRTALLIEGARRVGKSTIVKYFAQTEYRSYILIDFSKASYNIRQLFYDLSNLDHFFLQLKLFAGGTMLYERESVIIFDEVQKFPPAREAIKHLVADGRYDYIETGSLIGIQQNVTNIIIPSEEDKLQLHPLDYEEFRWALSDTQTLDILRDCFQHHRPLSDAVNRKLMFDFRLYMLIGGMPQAIREYLETNDLRRVDKIKRGILRLYADDFHKIDVTDKAKTLFLSIPSELSKNSTRYQTTKVISNIKTARAMELINLMQESMTVNVAYHINEPHVGFELSNDKHAYKMYLCDTGLFVSLAFWDKDFTENVIYPKLLTDKLDANLGYVYENMVAQMLTASGNKLRYHTFRNSSNHLYEIDFLLSKGNKIYPIEVKSSGYKTHASLDAFCQKFSFQIGNPFLIYTKDLQKDGETMMIPIYMTGLL